MDALSILSQAREGKGEGGRRIRSFRIKTVSLDYQKRTASFVIVMVDRYFLLR